MDKIYTNVKAYNIVYGEHRQCSNLKVILLKTPSEDLHIESNLQIECEPYKNVWLKVKTDQLLKKNRTINKK